MSPLLLKRTVEARNMVTVYIEIGYWCDATEAYIIKFVSTHICVANASFPGKDVCYSIEIRNNMLWCPLNKFNPCRSRLLQWKWDNHVIALFTVALPWIMKIHTSHYYNRNWHWKVPQSAWRVVAIIVRSLFVPCCGIHMKLNVIDAYEFA